MQESAEIRETVLRFYDALGSASAAEAVDETLSTDDAVTFIGTDPNEFWRGHDTITRIWGEQLRELGGFKLKPGKLVAFAEGDVGWFADDPTFELSEGEVATRITGVLRRENGGWKLVQGHASIGVANEEAVGQELPTS